MMKDNKEIKNLVNETIDDIDTELGIESEEENEVISKENVELLVNNLESNIKYYDEIVNKEIEKKKEIEDVVIKVFKYNYDSFKSYTLLTLEVFNKDLVNNEYDFPKFILDIHHNIVDCCNKFMKYITTISKSNISLLNYICNTFVNSNYLIIDTENKNNIINALKEIIKMRNDEKLKYDIPIIPLEDLIFISLVSSNDSVNNLFLNMMDNCCNNLADIISPLKEAEYKLFISLDSKEEDMTNTEFTVGLFKYEENDNYTEDDMVFKIKSNNIIHAFTTILLYILSVESDMRKKYECLRKLDDNGNPIESEELLEEVKINEFKDLDNLKSTLLNIDEILNLDIQ